MTLPTCEYSTDRGISAWRTHRERMHEQDPSAIHGPHVSLAHCSVVGRAVRGDLWAQCFSMAGLFVVTSFILFGVVFSAAFVMASRLQKPNEPSSPFAGEDPPEQIIVPIEIFPKT